MIRVGIILATSAVLGAACLPQQELGDLTGLIDAGNPDGGAPTRAELEAFGKRLVGRYSGFVESSGDPIAVEFRADGSYGTRCTAEPADLPRVSACPYIGVERTAEGRYQLVGIALSGDVEGFTMDTYVGFEVRSRLMDMAFGERGNRLTYTRVTVLRDNLAAVFAAFNPSTLGPGDVVQAREYIVLERER